MDVLILGAGFSAPAGLPGVDEFIPKVLKQWDSIARTAGLRSAEAAGFGRELEQLWAKRGKPDVEALLESSEASVEQRLLVTRFIKIALSGLSRQYIRNELRPVNRRTLDADFEGFARYVETRRPIIISLNYDMICEYLVREVLRMRDDYSIRFDGTGNRRRRSETTAAGGETAAGSGWNRPASRERVVVLKPLGSVSWTLCPSCGFATDFARHVTDRLLSEPPVCAKCGVAYHPLIVSPRQSERRRSDIPQLEESWDGVEKALRAGGSVCVCGYSFRPRDEYFSGLVKRSVGKGKRLRRLTLINPEGKARARLQKLFVNALGIEGVETERRRKKLKWNVSRFSHAQGNAGLLDEEPMPEGEAKAPPLASEPDTVVLACEEYDTFGDWLSGDEAG